MCTVSQTPDPTGNWHLYEFQQNNTNDYPKLAVWPDGYYLSTQRGFPNSGLDVVVFDRANMLNGNPATSQTFSMPNVPSLLFLPSDLDGPAPPVGSPNYIARMIDGNLFGGVDRIEIWEFATDWGVPADSLFALVNTIPTAAFDSLLCGANINLLQNCIPQPNTAQLLEGLTAWPMYRLQYRNFHRHGVLTFNHTVDADGNGGAGIRWYERRGGQGAWSIFQQGTYAPQQPLNVNSQWEHRWMGSIAMDKNGNMALG